jgi:hypothetical protein
VGIQEGWRGLVKGIYEPLTLPMVEEIIYQGGTMLGSSRTNPFKQGGEADLRRRLRNVQEPASTRSWPAAARTRWGRAEVVPLHGVPDGRRAQDDGQRPERDRLHVRLRHGGRASGMDAWIGCATRPARTGA